MASARAAEAAVSLTDRTFPARAFTWIPLGSGGSVLDPMSSDTNMGPPQMAPAGHDGVNRTSAWLVNTGGLSAAKTAPASRPSTAMMPTRALYRPMT